MTTLDILLTALRDARRELHDYTSRSGDVGTIVTREGCYFPAQMGTEEDHVLAKLMAILNSEELVAAMRTIERRSQFSVVEGGRI
jgi:hypothetical protein